jgi:hypothetical protein
MKSKLRLLFVILVMMLSACHFNRPFDSSGWIENPDNRFQMVADLEDSRLLIGKSRRELMEILSNECKGCVDSLDVLVYYTKMKKSFRADIDIEVFIVTLVNDTVVAASSGDDAFE